MYAKTRSPRISQRRGAFTLIELLIVITIIAVLISFLVVGVFSATRTARRTACTVEISNLSKAIADFEMEYGSAPPSFIILYETGTGGSDPCWAADTTTPVSVTAPITLDILRTQSRAAVRRIWPRYDFSQDVDIDGDGVLGEVHILNGAECLAFFLGGVDDPSAAGWQPTGFAANPQSPFAPVNYVSQPPGTPAAVTNRRGPYYETFDGSRFVDRDNDGFPEYLDALPDQTQPLQYFSSYEGTGYRPRGLDQVAGTDDDESSVATFVSHYIKANSAASGADPIPTSPSASWYPSKFQIISAGFDFEFGSGGVYDGSSLPASGSETYAAGARETNYEKDNITNFTGRELN